MTAPATRLQVWCDECGCYRDYTAEGYCSTCRGIMPCTVTRRPVGVALTAVCDTCGGRVKRVEYRCAFPLCRMRVDSEPVARLFGDQQCTLDIDGEPDLPQHIRDKLRIMRADGWHCHYCGMHQGELTAHGVALDVDWRNYVAACDECMRVMVGAVVQRAMEFEDELDSMTDAA